MNSTDAGQTGLVQVRLLLTQHLLRNRSDECLAAPLCSPKQPLKLTNCGRSQTQLSPQGVRTHVPRDFVNILCTYSNDRFSDLKELYYSSKDAFSLCSVIKIDGLNPIKKYSDFGALSFVDVQIGLKKHRRINWIFCRFISISTARLVAEISGSFRFWDY